MKPPQKASREVSNPQPGSWRPGKPPPAPNPAPRAELKHLNALPQPCPQRGAAPARAQQSPHSLPPAGENSRLTAQLGEGGEEESRGLFTRGRDLAVKTPREGKKKIINRSLEGNEAAQKAPVLPRARQRGPGELPARGQQGTGKFLQNPSQPWPPPAAHSPARGSVPAPQPRFRVTQELGIRLPSARDAPRGGAARSRCLRPARAGPLSTQSLF